MPAIRLLAIVLTMVLAPVDASAQHRANSSVADEIALRTAIFDRVATAAADRDFAALNALAEDLRSGRARTLSGTWQLAYFYHGWMASLPRQADAGTCDNFDPHFIEAWTAADPRSPTSYIAHSITLQRKAWCIRGSGFAASVAPQAMTQFVSTMLEARAVLEDHRDMASADPRFYEEIIHTAIALAMPRDQFEQLVEEASDREPYYYGIYFAASQYYLPQWFGEPGDLDRLGRMAVAKTPDDGSGSYARLFWYIDECRCLNLDDLDWSLMRAGMMDVADAYPNDLNSANFARLACMAADSESARVHLARLSSDSVEIWPSPSVHRNCLILADRH